MNDFFERPQRKAIKGLNIVPILDMFTTVIFFLLLSTTFIHMTKLTVPPSGVSTVSDPVLPPPLNPKTFIDKQNNTYHLKLAWSGSEPGAFEDQMKATGEDRDQLNEELYKISHVLIKKFKEKYPSENTIQLSLSSGVMYQEMITVMDAIRHEFPDIVLLSYLEAEAELRKNPSENLVGN